MARLVYKNGDKTVSTISERNAISRKIDGMLVLVKDAIADPEIVSGPATYRYVALDDSWVLISDIDEFSSGDRTKLDGIESGATADQTKSDIDALGIDADTLDGQHGAYYRNASNLNAGTVDNARLPASITSDITGNAGTATKLNAPRTIALGGDLSGSASFDGSANITITGIIVDDSHNHTISNIDGLSNELGNKLELGGTVFGGTYPLTFSVNGSIYSHPDITYNGADNDLEITDGSITHKSGTEGCRVEYNATSKSLEYNFF